MTAPPIGVRPDLRRRAADVVAEVGDRLRSPGPVAAAAVRARRPVGHPRWDRSSLLLGHPGIAVLHATLSTGDASWAGATHAHLSCAGSYTGSGTTPPDLSPSALADLVPAAVLHRDAHGGYAKLLRTAGDALAKTCAAQVTAQRRRRSRQGPGVAAADYDAVAGLTGTGRILLTLGDDRSADALAATLRHLVALTRPVTAYGTKVPGWWCHPDRYPLPADREQYPRGDLNAGLAHGIAGPLALMAVAHQRGHRVDDVDEAMRTIVDWLLRWRTVDEFGPVWPSRIGLDEETGAERPPTAPAKAAWCYGTAGVARALHLAGAALGDPELCALAVDALRGVFRRPWGKANLAGPTVCHGEAGLLQVVLRVTERDPDPLLLTAAGALVQRILTGYDTRAPFGFRHAHHSGPGVVVGVDEPGLLQGAAGVALALATFARLPGTGGDTAWDAALLLT